MGGVVRAMLCVGLRNGHGKTIAPRLLTERGEWVVASALPRDGRPTSLAERVTYLASITGRSGCFDVEVCDDGTPILGEKHEPSEQARAAMAARGWSAP